MRKSQKSVIKISEDNLQAQCVEWFRIAYPKHVWSLYAIPNSGKRSIITAKNMKRTGQLPGVWDLHLCVPNNDWCGLYIEMKVGHNKLTDNQIAFADANQAHYKFVVCYTFEEFMEAINIYLNQNG